MKWVERYFDSVARQESVFVGACMYIVAFLVLWVALVVPPLLAMVLAGPSSLLLFLVVPFVVTAVALFKGRKK